MVKHLTRFLRKTFGFKPYVFFSQYFFGIILLAVGTLALGSLYLNNKNVDYIVQEFVSGFIKIWSNVKEVVVPNTYEIFDLYKKQREELIKENHQLKNQIFYLENENNSLRKIHKLNKRSSYKTITARILTRFDPTFTNSVLVDSGKESGVKEGNIVLYADQLIGRVIQVSTKSSKILLLSDPNSQIPVTGSVSGAYGILIGQGGEDPVIKFISGEFIKGEVILTSGECADIPAGLIVGKIKDLINNNVLINLEYRKTNYVSINTC